MWQSPLRSLAMKAEIPRFARNDTFGSDCRDTRCLAIGMRLPRHKVPGDNDGPMIDFNMSLRAFWRGNIDRVSSRGAKRRGDPDNASLRAALAAWQSPLRSLAMKAEIPRFARNDTLGSDCRDTRCLAITMVR